MQLKKGGDRISEDVQLKFTNIYTYIHILCMLLGIYKNICIYIYICIIHHDISFKKDITVFQNITFKTARDTKGDTSSSVVSRGIGNQFLGSCEYVMDGF